jgi:hypothetical protein
LKGCRTARQGFIRKIDTWVSFLFDFVFDSVLSSQKISGRWRIVPSPRPNLSTGEGHQLRLGSQKRAFLRPSVMAVLLSVLVLVFSEACPLH